MKTLYYESHITIKPVFDERLEYAKGIATHFGFKMAELLMKKREEENPSISPYDTFMTGHDEDYENLLFRMKELIGALHFEEFYVFRYKIESVVLDSRFKDSLNIL